MKYSKYIFFVVLLIAIAIQFFAKETVWWYIDSWWLLFYKFSNINYLSELLYSIFPWTGFWYDRSAANLTRWIWYFLAWIVDQRLYLLLFFLANFYFMKEVLKILFSNKSATLWWLFFSINLVSVYMANQIWFLYAYTSFPIIIYALHRIYTENRFKNYILLVLGVFLFLSYTRIIWLYWFLFLLLFFLFRKDILKTWYLFYKKTIVVIICWFFWILPFSFSIIYPYVDGDHKYFSWLSNYAEVWEEDWWNTYINNLKNQSMLQIFYWSEPTKTLISEYTSTSFFNLLHSLIFLLLIVMCLNIKKWNNHINIVVIVILLLTWMKVWSKFLPDDIFISIIYQYFPFLANNTWRLNVIIVTLLAYVIWFIWDSYQNKSIKFFYWILIVYFISIFFPFFNFKNNPKFSTISVSDIPTDLRKSFIDNDSYSLSSLMLPLHKLVFNRSPYYIYMNYNKKYKDLLNWNSRLVNSKQVAFRDKINNVLNYRAIWNLSILNLKNIIVFTWIRNAKQWEFEYYSSKDYVWESEKIIKRLNVKSLDKSISENYNNYSLKESENYEFTIYSPWLITYGTVDEFLNNPINIQEKPVFIDEDAYKYQSNWFPSSISPSNRNINIDIKTSPKNSTKYFLNISNVDLSEAFLIQLNQTFSNSWKLKRITRREYEDVKCLDDRKEFSISQNRMCTIWNTYLDLSEWRYFSHSEVNPINHFEGNMVWNTWIIPSSESAKIWDDDNRLYAVLWYEKQFFYSLIIILSLWFLWVLIFLAIFQEISMYMKNIANDI